MYDNPIKFTDIKVRTLILWGKEDEIFPISLAEEMNRGIASSSLNLVDGSHDWIFFKTDEFLKIFEEWINKLNN